MKYRFAFVSLFLSTLIAFPALANIVEIERAFLEQDYPRAEVLAQEALKKSTSDSEAQYQYYLGLSQLRLTKYGLAASALKDMVNDTSVPNELRDKAHLALIDAYFLAEKYDLAGRLADQFVSVSVNSDYLSTLYLKLARIRFKQAQFTEARLYLRKIVNEYPSSLDVYLAKQFLQEKMYFSVQVGSFRDRGRAKDLIQQLNAEGRTAYIFEVKDHLGQKYYRVRVGQLSYLDQAKGLQDQLAKQGYPTRIYP